MEGRVVGVEPFDVVAGLAHGVQVPLHLGQLGVGDPGGGKGRGDRFEGPPYLHEVLQGDRVALQRARLRDRLSWAARSGSGGSFEPGGRAPVRISSRICSMALSVRDNAALSPGRAPRAPPI
ncbi:hypothetical protein ADL12_23690 [Streptomyces regalis]|uniref:Uncharacterized protein n=1 Tax=Streptomyces regalis TaxID=68262 RepID=A0A101JSG1_9ACTN|nr:hypothetical protein ADL12_23690 [Streptomyces regalis]